MHPSWAAFLILSLIPPALANAQASQVWRAKRQLASDLEVGGALAGLAPDSTSYVTREELLSMRQVSFTVTDDATLAALTAHFRAFAAATKP